MKTGMVQLLIGAIPNFNEFIDRLGAKTFTALAIVGALTYLAINGTVPGEWAAVCMVITGVGFFAFRRAQEKEQTKCAREPEEEEPNEDE